MVIDRYYYYHYCKDINNRLIIESYPMNVYLIGTFPSAIIIIICYARVYNWIGRDGRGVPQMNKRVSFGEKKKTHNSFTTTKPESNWRHFFPGSAH